MVAIIDGLRSFRDRLVSGPSNSGAVTVDALDPFLGAISAYAGQSSWAPWQNSVFDGEKYPGGFGATQLYEMDYWTIRARSRQLFETVLYARGMIRRLVTNEINRGLFPETCPDEKLLGLVLGDLAEWSDDIEDRFSVWASMPDVCDWLGEHSLAEIQRTARREALVAGDVLCVLHDSPVRKSLSVQLLPGEAVQTPYLDDGQDIPKSHKIRHGIELDKRGRHYAYWVRQPDGDLKRILARGRRSGRRMAWMVYGTDRLLDGVRGQSLLAILLQSIAEIDRYRDSVQRKAVINSLLAMFIKKDRDKMGSNPMQGGAIRKGATTVADADGGTRQFQLANSIPGIVFENLQAGEEPVGFHNQGIDLAFGPFEEAIVQAMAWASEIPPEILRLAFSNNYSASQAAINEFKIYLEYVWDHFGGQFNAPIYREFLLTETLYGRVKADGFLDAWRDPSRYVELGAWLRAEWYGSIKPSTDMLKQAKSSELLMRLGLSTHAREARITTGTKFSKNVQRLKRENESLKEAAEAGMVSAPEEQDSPTREEVALGLDELRAEIEEFLEDRGES